MARKYSTSSHHGGGGGAKLQDILKVKTEQFATELSYKGGTTKFGSQVELVDNKASFWSSKPPSSSVIQS